MSSSGLLVMQADLNPSAKYPLAVVEVLLEVFGVDIGGGYDIGCKFGTTLNRSELGPRARALNYKALVGSFHGHAHNRLCQLSFLATYVKGMGLEDLEGCERFFSKSNALASSLRYASVFHRQQKMIEFMRHMDLETYQNLSKPPIL
jgi:Kyakuja-Dileera-Zisupton transposase